MIEIVNGILGIFTALFEAIIEIFTSIFIALFPSRKKTEYNADFGVIDDILYTQGDGIYLGSTWCNSRKDATRHTIVFGTSGAGKSTLVGIPTLLQSFDCSYINNDPAREGMNKASGSLLKNKQQILVLDLNRPECSIGFNPVAYCKTQTDTYALANVLIKNSLEGSANDYWAQSAEDMVAFFLYFLVSYAEPEHKNISNAIYLIRTLSFSPRKIDRMIVSTHDAKLLTRYRSLVATPSKTLNCTIATALTALRIFEAPNIAHITSRDELDFDSLRTSKTTLFLCSSASDSYLYRSVTACLFESFFSYILHSEPSPDTHPITILIDESAHYYLPSLSQALSLLRKYNVSIVTMWQDISQITHLYGKEQATNILANSHTKVFMPGSKPLETALMLEKMCGKYSYIDDDGNTGTRELLTANEINELDKVLVLCGNKPPVLLKPEPYYENKRLSKLASIPPYCIPERHTDAEPSLIELPIE